jgi:Uma2 family endonuclease
MVSQAQPASPAEIFYPESDGQLMADNTQQFRWITTLQQNLDWLFADNAAVFVAGDLLWYPVEGSTNLSTAPDVMVVLGRPKGDRGSYKQWEEDNIPPQVVFEILSTSNTTMEMSRKLLFYDRYGVEEYYIYDPGSNQLTGWLRTEGFLSPIEPIADWQSPRLEIQFDLQGAELQVLYPDGRSFLSFGEIADRSERECQLTELQRLRAEQAENRAEQAENRAEQEYQRAQQAENRAAKLAEQLRAMGIEPD